MHTKCKKFKKGAASFYIVALSTLILVIIATSFATVILSEASRSENDDLSQSAYDSALAGVEDAKLAFANFKRCVESSGANTKPDSLAPGNSVTCQDIIYWVQKSDCYTVGHILGKIPKSVQFSEDDTYEVAIGGTTVAAGSTETTTNQAYTCVKINTDLSDYKSTLNSGHMSQIIRAGVGDGSSNTVSKVRISWYSTENKTEGNYSNFKTNRVAFGAVANSISSYAVPPTLEVQIVQTAENFKLSDFDTVEGDKTNRGTVYLVPSNNATQAKNSNGTNFVGVYDGTSNEITAKQVAETNNRTVSNKPFVVYCDKNNGEFYCIVDIDLPKAIGSTNGKDRANDTFMIGISLPYQKPNTEFSMTLICDGGATGSETVCDGAKGDNITGTQDAKVKTKNTQVSIDSTGRANDLYRRVETRIETQDRAFGYGLPYYALQILGDSGATKQMTVTYENAFYF